MPQTSVLTTFAKAFPGLDPDTSLGLGDYISRAASDAALQLPFGSLVVQGANDDQCRAIAAQADSLLMLGLVVYDAAYSIPAELGSIADANGNIGLLYQTMVRIKTRGRLWVQIDEDCSESAKASVRVRTAAVGGGVGPGIFRKTAAAGNTLDLSKFCKWVGTNKAADGYGLLQFDFTMRANASAD